MELMVHCRRGMLELCALHADRRWPSPVPQIGPLRYACVCVRACVFMCVSVCVCVCVRVRAHAHFVISRLAEMHTHKRGRLTNMAARGGGDLAQRVLSACIQGLGGRLLELLGP